MKQNKLTLLLLAFVCSMSTQGYAGTKRKNSPVILQFEPKHNKAKFQDNSTSLQEYRNQPKPWNLADYEKFPVEDPMELVKLAMWNNDRTNNFLHTKTSPKQTKSWNPPACEPFPHQDSMELVKRAIRTNFYQKSHIRITRDEMSLFCNE
jgi:hypothetical protein